MKKRKDIGLIAWIAFRGILATVVIGGILCFLAAIFLPEISDPISDQEIKLSNIFGVGVWLISILLGGLWTKRFWDNS